MKVGDIITQYLSSGECAYKLEVLEVGGYKSKVLVLDSRISKLVGKEQMWITDIIKELMGWEND